MSGLAAESKRFLENFRKLPVIQHMKPTEARDALASIPRPAVELEALSKIEDIKIEVDQAQEITLRIYTPEGTGPFPVIVYYHGGGWVIGDLSFSDASCRMLANGTNSIVISAEYRLSPEFKFPAPAEDAYKALEWVYEHAASLNGDASHISVCGDSAGGNLATVVSMMARDRGTSVPEAQILLYPVTDLSHDTVTYTEFAEGFGLDADLMKWFGSHYIRSEKDRQLPYISPLRAEDLGGLPPAIIVTAEFDVLREEGEQYAARLKEAGNVAEYRCESGMIHAYFTNAGVFLERIGQTISAIHDFLQTERKKKEELKI
ncbi:alpha/beta hydrolase [Sporosarcina sp. P1]|uniref:alpha/beta hydrolase n=1 Tax=Sporosarcina sp. P1 TaxID=2048257 RepID=UPI000C1669E8|nr:alpha/beta hydrolase [Sporosarcina sp. P1]PIC82993.1 esterase [Sporosarcina sp. P1]